MIKISTFGGSHDKTIGGEIKGLPRGFAISIEAVQKQLKNRKIGIGRSKRQNIETDILNITSGLNHSGKTNGFALKFYVENVDNKLSEKPPITALRPGHADLVGCQKFGYDNARDVAEIAGGRSTLAHTVIGAICRQILAQKGIFTYAFTENIGGISTDKNFDYYSMANDIENSAVRTIDKTAEKAMVEKITQTIAEGDTLGGIVQVGAVGLPMCVGDYHNYFDKLDAKISAYLLAIPSVKGITFGLGEKFAAISGFSSNDKLTLNGKTIEYATNNCGGIVGGMSNGKPILARLIVKPVPSVARESETIDIKTLETVKTHYERSDFCVVPNIAVIAENMLATVLLDTIMQDKKIAKELGIC